MEYLVKLITPYLVSEVDNAKKNKSREQREYAPKTVLKPIVQTEEGDVTPIVAAERRKNQDRRKKKLARGRWFESRMKQDRRKENQFNTKI